MTGPEIHHQEHDGMTGTPPPAHLNRESATALAAQLTEASIAVLEPLATAQDMRVRTAYYLLSALRAILRDGPNVDATEEEETPEQRAVFEMGQAMAAVSILMRTTQAGKERLTYGAPSTSTTSRTGPTETGEPTS